MLFQSTVTLSVAKLDIIHIGSLFPYKSQELASGGKVKPNRKRADSGREGSGPASAAQKGGRPLSEQLLSSAASVRGLHPQGEGIPLGALGVPGRWSLSAGDVR